MSSPHCLRGLATAIASATLMIAFAAPADAGVVGKKAMLTWTGGGSIIDQQTFLIEDTGPEYSWDIDVSGTWAAITVDFSEKGMKLRYSSGDPFGSTVSFHFGSNALFRIEMSPEVQLDSAILSGAWSVEGLSASAVSVDRNYLVVNMTQVGLMQSGAGIDIEYQTSTVRPRGRSRSSRRRRRSARAGVADGSSFADGGVPARCVGPGPAVRTAQRRSERYFSASPTM